MARLGSYKQLRRYREVAVVLARHGLGALADHLGLSRRRLPAGTSPKRFPGGEDPWSIAVRLRRVLEDLGPTFIKIGQLLSTRADLVPPHILKELQKLQDDATPFPFPVVRQLVERELGAELDRVFAHVDPQPLATASIGQVHVAQLKSGEEVVIKVQRPNARQTMEADLEILLGLAELASRHSPWAEVYPFEDVARELARTLLQELDYVREAIHAERLRRQTGAGSELYVPRVFWQYTTSRLLTLERLRGRKLSEAVQSGLTEAQRRSIARTLITGILEQIFLHGFFHADPHPGNVVVLEENRIGLLDFGIVGRLDETTREHLGRALIHLLRGNVKGLVATLASLLEVPPDADLRGLRRDLEDLRERYYQRPFRQIELSEVVQTLFSVLRQHHLRVPADLTLVGKTLITLEGVALQLDPELSVLELAEPLGQRLIGMYASPRAVSRRLLDQLDVHAQPILELPGVLRNVLTEVQRGRALLHVEITGRKDLQNTVSRLVNRLTFSILLLAFSILIGSLLVAVALAGKTAPVWGIPLLQLGTGLLGLAVAVLLWAIFRSGRF